MKKLTKQDWNEIRFEQNENDHKLLYKLIIGLYIEMIAIILILIIWSW